LEEDIAMSNMSLDLIGQARLFYSFAADVEEKNRTEDNIAYERDARQFKNVLLAEQPNGDFATTMVRQLFISVYQYHLYRELSKSKNETLAGIANKSLKEVTYHVRHATDWVLRLGDGTEESHDRAQAAVNDLWIFTDDLFDGDSVDAILLKEKVGADLSLIKSAWQKQVNEVLAESTLTIPAINSFMRTGSRKGNHTEYLGYILAEMQFLPRAYPGTKW
jgi:ring-1,2-phenylacetyl-CoA epoxidase subunit PaaC